MSTSSSGPGGLNLSALASQAQGETDRRIRGGSDNLRAGLASLLQERSGYARSEEEAQGRGHAFEKTQQELDFALARRQQAMQEAAAAASRRYSSLSAQRENEAKIAREKAENADWFDKQRFTTDENIRQAMALAALEPKEEESDIYKPSDFGGAVMDPLRGQALANAFPGQFSPTEKERDWVTDHQYDEDFLRQLREHFGNRSRTASRALYDVGYGLGGG